MEKAGDTISVIDLEGRILYWNEGAERIYEYPQAEALGKKLSEILYPGMKRPGWKRIKFWKTSWPG